MACFRTGGMSILRRLKKEYFRTGGMSSQGSTHDSAEDKKVISMK